jgi:hypothetical protein
LTKKKINIIIKGMKEVSIAYGLKIGETFQTLTKEEGIALRDRLTEVFGPAPMGVEFIKSDLVLPLDRITARARRPGETIEMPPGSLSPQGNI